MMGLDMAMRKLYSAATAVSLAVDPHDHKAQVAVDSVLYSVLDVKAEIRMEYRRYLDMFNQFAEVLEDLIDNTSQDNVRILATTLLRSVYAEQLELNPNAVQRNLDNQEDGNGSD
jgi:CRISPR/Cas system CSM-associated protein Csm2 small subunit